METVVCAANEQWAAQRCERWAAVVSDWAAQRINERGGLRSGVKPTGYDLGRYRVFEPSPPSTCCAALQGCCALRSCRKYSRLSPSRAAVAVPSLSSFSFSGCLPRSSLSVFSSYEALLRARNAAAVWPRRPLWHCCCRSQGAGVAPDAVVTSRRLLWLSSAAVRLGSRLSPSRSETGLLTVWPPAAIRLATCCRPAAATVTSPAPQRPRRRRPGG
jgi:hypothetical protein